MDEVDRFIQFPLSSEFFALLRSWHNDRIHPDSPWQTLTLVIAYSEEPYRLIPAIAESPFNVGVRIDLGDFNIDQVGRLNESYGSPLPDPKSLERFQEFLDGHPFLVLWFAKIVIGIQIKELADPPAFVVARMILTSCGAC